MAVTDAVATDAALFRPAGTMRVKSGVDIAAYGSLFEGYQYIPDGM
jgi:hypothetical protein